MYDGGGDTGSNTNNPQEASGRSYNADSPLRGAGVIH